MAVTVTTLRNHKFQNKTVEDRIVVLENTLARDVEQFELVIFNGYFGEVRNVEDVANGDDILVNIDSNRIICTDQVGAGQTFAVGGKVWFDPNAAGAAGALYDAENVSDFVAVGIVTAIDTASQAYLEFRPFAQDTDITLVRDAASAAEAVALNTAHRGLVAGNPHVVTVAELSLDNVDNTTDLLKPPSTAQILIDGDQDTAIGLNTTHRGLVAGNPHVVTKAEVGLTDVDDTTDLLKPPSTAQILIDGDQDTAIGLNTTHRGLVTGNPHVVTKAEVGLTDVDDTTDLLKPPSTAQIALNTAYALNAAKTVALPITADASGGIEFVLATYGLAAGDKIFDVLVVATTSEANGALTLSHTGGNAITDAIACVTTKAIDRVATLDQAEVTIGAATLKITAAGDTPGDTRGIMYVSYIPA